MISKVLLDLPFSLNQPLISADDLYIRILENKVKNIEVLDQIKKNQKDKNF
jgi:predicted RNA-binding protein